MTYFCWLNSDAGLYLSGSSACCITVRPEAASELALLFDAVKTCRNFHPGQEKSLFYHIFAFIRLVSDSSNRDAGLCYPPKFWHLLFDLSPGLEATKALPPSSQRTRFNRGCSHAELLRRNTRHSRAKRSWFFTHILTQRKMEVSAENLAHHSCEIRGWRYPEMRRAPHYGRARAAETPSAPDYINPHLTAWHIFCWQSTSISCQAASFPQIYRLNWINYI